MFEAEDSASKPVENPASWFWTRDRSLFESFSALTEILSKSSIFSALYSGGWKEFWGKSGMLAVPLAVPLVCPLVGTLVGTLVVPLVCPLVGTLVGTLSSKESWGKLGTLVVPPFSRGVRGLGIGGEYKGMLWLLGGK